MIALYKRELSVFFSTLIGPLIIGLFLLSNSLILWSDISQINILENAYADMDSFFSISPLIFLMFIPALSMASFSLEYSRGTIEILITKPITAFQIVFAKFFSILTVVVISLLPTLIYIASIFVLGET